MHFSTEMRWLRPSSPFVKWSKTVTRFYSTPPHPPLDPSFFPPGPRLWGWFSVDEEKTPNYNSRNFYPAEPGQVVGDHYQLYTKTGWGPSSTSWLALDLNKGHGYNVIVKIHNIGHDTSRQRRLEGLINKADPYRHGAHAFLTFNDSFTVSGPEGDHQCMVYDNITRDSMARYMMRLKGGVFSPVQVKLYLRFLLKGLRFLHEECGIVHGNLTRDNILMSLEDKSAMTDYITKQIDHPMPSRIDATGRRVYKSRYDLGPLRKPCNQPGNWINSLPLMSDFELSAHLPPGQPGLYPIQADGNRAPEVILGCGWDTKADIWNLGVLIWRMMQITPLFPLISNLLRGHYDARAHLAQMISLLGPPPRDVALLSNSMISYQWPFSVMTDRGVAADSTAKYFQGPFFNDDGKFLFPDLVTGNSSLASTVKALRGPEETEAFLSFVSGMLTWRPEDRKTARELLKHPFLNSQDMDS
ncbi:kinase-like domain-containing protein [Aspergillus heterothallicus]